MINPKDYSLFLKTANTNPERYNPLFRIDGIITNLHSEFFLKTSIGKGDSLIIQNNGTWHTFIDKEKEKECMQKGLELFRDKEKYEEYANNFRKFIEYAKKEIIPKFKIPREVSKKEFEELIQHFINFWNFYGYTEFFYHDLAYERMQQTNNPILKENLEDLGKLKFEGRKILNAFIFEKGVLLNILKPLSIKYLEEDEDAIYLYSKEILGLFEGKIPPKKVINERKKCYALTRIDNNLIKYTHKKSLKLFNNFTQPKKNNMIKGIVAKKGKAKGKVVIAPMLTNIEEINKVISKMEQGDILVAHSTTPELMTLIDKAAAIVTDQGGMLSHAAVISREFNIPCVIGTKIATKVLKDGDKVEVDAENGIVTKL
jgi:phosphohistidine swiveling domain-containing protein